MKSVFSVIDCIREAKGLSKRKLAMNAGIRPTTFASMMERRPDSIDVDYLRALGSALNMNWYELIGKDEEPATMYLEKVSTKLDPEEALRIVKKYAVPDLDKYRIDIAGPDLIPKTEESPKRPTVDSAEFQRSFFFALNRLNDDGLMEAMRRVLDVATDPKFCVSADLNTKEDDLCQEKEQ